MLRRKNVNPSDGILAAVSAIQRQRPQRHFMPRVEMMQPAMELTDARRVFTLTSACRADDDFSQPGCLFKQGMHRFEQEQIS